MNEIELKDYQKHMIKEITQHCSIQDLNKILERLYYYLTHCIRPLSVSEILTAFDREYGIRKNTSNMIGRPSNIEKYLNWFKQMPDSKEEILKEAKQTLSRTSFYRLRKQFTEHTKLPKYY